MSQRFVADVGGTNVRLALVDNGRIVKIEKYLCSDFNTIGEAILHFQKSTISGSFVAGCIAIACPINGDMVRMTNHSWTFSQRELTSQLSLDKLYVINDFAAVAHSLPALNQNQLIQIGEGNANTQGNIAVFGPGTGLGVEHLTWTKGGWKTLDGEGGHVDFAPVDDTDIVVWHHLKKKLGRVSYEEVLSGRGIVNIYEALCLYHKKPIALNTPSQVTNAGLKNNNEMAVLAIQQFCKTMGSFAGNLALNLCTTGGIFIGGGVTSHLGDYFLNSEFRQRFEEKGDFGQYVHNIPTYLINEPDHGLLGALAYLIQQSENE